MSVTRALTPCSLSLLLVAALGCAGSSQPRVKVSYSDIPKEQGAAPAPAVPAAPVETAAIPAATAADGAPVSPREAMEKALAWATEGLRFYEAGKWEDARKSLNDARIMLLEADMPKFWQDQGLAVLKSGLPEELRRYDPEAIIRELSRTDRLTASERVERAAIEREVRRILHSFGDTTPDEKYLNILVYETERYIDFFRGKNRTFFERSYMRKHKYWPVVREVFTARNLPVELGYIAFIESGFNPRAVSHANAIGLWQFIPDTGRRYGLTAREDFHDVRRSTEAAAGYLIDLLSIFGSPSFLLATASYNAGEGRIMGCLRQIDNPFQQRSFWEIRPCLALETQEYVPKIMAAAVLSADPKRFGFNLLDEEEMRRHYEIVTVGPVTSLARLAEMAGISLSDLRAANNEIDAYAATTPGRNFPLYVPRGTGQQLAAALAASPPPEVLPPSEPLVFAKAKAEKKPDSSKTSNRLSGKVYVVRGGDTLSSIARKHDLDVDTVADWNRLRRPYSLRVGQRLIIPSQKGASSSSEITYTVQPGNTLGSIAEIFKVSEKDIKEWNDLGGNSVKPGKKLTIRPGKDFESRTHTVRGGDTLSSIARRFGVSVDHLRTVNGLDEDDILQPGQELRVYVPA